MITSRRSFLGGLGFVLGVNITASSDSTEGAYWSGWREPMNQFITFGMWMYPIPGSNRKILVSTTLGHVGVYREMDVVDLSYSHGWIPILPWSTQADRDAVKERALQALLRTVRDQ